MSLNRGNVTDLYFVHGWKYYLLYERISVRKLVFGLSRMGGRNHLGRSTLYHRGGGCKRRYRLVDFIRRVDSFGLVLSIGYDPNRSGLLALVCYFNGVISYVLASNNLLVGDILFSGGRVGRGSKVLRKLVKRKALLGTVQVAKNFFVNVFRSVFMDGSAMALREISSGVLVHNIEFCVGKGGKFARAAGTSALVVRRRQHQVLLKLRSGFMVYVSRDCFATIGSVSNANHRYQNLLKAGTSRRLGRRSVVRGVAMNPVDHPHGGGEGKGSGRRAARTPWGRFTKSTSTVIRKDKYYIFSRVR